MLRKCLIIIACNISLMAYAQPNYEDYFSNITFTIYDEVEHENFKYYFSDYGLVIANLPGRHKGRGKWYVKDKELCIKWIHLQHTDCYGINITGHLIELYKTPGGGNKKLVFTLSNPKKGNRFNRLSATKQRELDGEVLAVQKKTEQRARTDRVDDAKEIENVGQDTREKEFAISVGSSLRYFAFNIATDRSDEKIDDIIVSPGVVLRTPYSYFNPKSRFGWFIEAGFSDYEVEDDCYSCTEIYSYSSAKGSYAYVAPTIFLSMSNPWYKKKRTGEWKLGLGFGPAYIKGNANLDNNRDISTDDENVEYSLDGYISNLYIDYRTGFFRVPYLLLHLRFNYSNAYYENDAITIHNKEIGVALNLSVSL